MSNSTRHFHDPRAVLHVITPSHMSGAEMFLARLLRHARDGRYAHHCVVRSGAANAELRAAGVDFETLAVGGKANLLAPARLRAAARRCRAQVLHSHLSSASWWCGWLEQLGGPPSVGHVHGFTSPLWHRWQSHAIACSEAVKRHLVEGGIEARRISVLHYPVDPDDMQPTRAAADVRADFGVAADTPIVGTFAHLSPKKGYRELVQAAALVLDQMPGAEFWCFGEGRLRHELQQTARELGIAGRFRLHGFRRDVPDLMRAIDVMCLPSHREPFGLVYIEAALMGKPVIACDAGGAPEIIIHGETGLLVPPPVATRPAANVTPLAEAILELLDNRERAVAMGRRGRHSATDRYAWPDYLARLNSIYDRVLAEQSEAGWLPGFLKPDGQRASAWYPRVAMSRTLRMAVAMIVIVGLAVGWASDRRQLAALRQLDSITYEVFNDRTAFERRLAGATRWVDFDDIGTGCAELAAFEPNRYADRGIVIRGAGGQYVARTFGLPAQIHAVSQPNAYAPGPVGVHPGGNRTDVEFTADDQAALVCGFGLSFVDVNNRDEDRSQVAVFDRHGRLLISHDSTHSGDWRTAFRGIVAVDSQGKPVPVIARVQLVGGVGWSRPEAGGGVAMDDFVYSVPRPY